MFSVTDQSIPHETQQRKAIHRIVGVSHFGSWDGLSVVTYRRCSCGELLRDDGYATIWQAHAAGDSAGVAWLTMDRLNREVSHVLGLLLSQQGATPEQAASLHETYACAVAEQREYAARYGYPLAVVMETKMPARDTRQLWTPTLEKP